MTKKLLSILLAGVAVLFAVSAFAGEATTLFIETDSTTATVYGTEYLRGRILILDANGELADTFGGGDITDATFTITAVNNGTDVTFSTDPATDSSPTFSIDSGDSFSVTDAWQEFAVDVNNVDEPGDETIRVALKKSSSQITADKDISIEAPEANTFVLLTGGVGTTYDVLEALPATQQDDKSAKKNAGDSTTIDVYAAFYRSSDGKFYLTDNIPEEMLSPTISGVDGHGYNIGIGSGAVTLTDGHASTTIQIKDIKTKELLAYRVGTWTTAAQQMAAMSWIMANGMTVTWSASAGYSRQIGAKAGDVNSSEELEVGMLDRDKYYMSPTAYASRTDRSWYKPTTCENITILGLPVNEVTSAGAHKEAGFLAVTQAPGTANISPLDAYFLAPDPTKKPSGGAFKTAGDPTSATKIYGAVVSYDQYNNPAPVTSGSNAANDTKIYLKHTTVGSATEAINATVTTEVSLPTAYGAIAAGTAYISNTYAYQAFFPFIVGTSLLRSTALTDTYIDQITVDATAIDEDAFEDTVSTANLGVDFIAQNTIGALTQTVATDITIVQDDDTEIEIIGRGTEKSYEMYAIRGADGVKMSMGPEDSTSGSSSVSIAFDEDESAKSKVVFFTTAPGNSATVNPFGWSRNIHMIFQGDDADTYVQSPVVVTANSNAGIKPVEGGDAEPAAINFIVKTYNATLDPAENHNVATYSSSVGMWSIMVFDAYMNMYTLYGGSSIEDAELSGAIYDVVDGVTADTPNAAHKVEVDTNKVSVEFDLESITADQDEFVIKLSSDQGNTSGQAKIKPAAMQSLMIDNVFLAVPGIDDTPIETFFASQAGKKVTPVTITGITNTTGNSIEVELEADNGTISAGTLVTLTTASDRSVFTAKPSTGKECMSIDGDPDISGIDAVTLNLCFTPDFEAATISSAAGGNCSIIITIADDVAVDTAGTKVTVKNADGEDITDTLTRTNTDSGLTGTITLQTLEIGLYSVIIIPTDKAGNIGDEETKTVSVTECDLQPACTGIEPVSALPGETVDVTITVNEDAPIGTGATVAFDCAGITINSTTVDSATEISVNITVADDAAEATCAITISTPAQEITQDCEFTIGAPPAECIDADNDTYGENCDAGADCDDTDPAVNPGAEEVCDDGIDNNCDGTVDEGCEVLCEIASITPSSISTGFGLLPRVRFLTITGNEVADFSNTSTVTFDPAQGIFTLFKSGSGDTIRVLVLVWGAAKGDVDVSVDDCTGGTLTIQ